MKPTSEWTGSTKKVDQRCGDKPEGLPDCGRNLTSHQKKDYRKDRALVLAVGATRLEFLS